ncbi:MAG TPA: hypothetical protein VJG32_14615 [Anaerolineae bacterium]|nr:hypothetical protein [Anaerolineae bacterium]
MRSTPYERFAGTCAILAAIGGVAYGVAFVVLGNKLLYSLLLMLGGLVSVVVLVALYRRLREVDESLGLLALLVGVVGALGSVTHGGYDLATVIHPTQVDVPGIGNVPVPIDPRGLLTFGFAGLGLLLFAALMTRSALFPKSLGNLGYVLGALLVIIYLGRLIILDPTNIIVRIALLAGVSVNTIWFIWLGQTLRRS